MLYAEVAVEVGRAGTGPETYTYRVPEGMEVVPGHRVVVPFGRRSVRGYLVGLTAEDPGLEVRGIESAETEALLVPHQVELARLIAAHYWAPLLDCLRAMVPPRIRGGKSSGAGPSTRQRRHSQLLMQARAGGRRDSAPPLAPDQIAALEVIRSSGRTLLHGVTASGKTEVYLAAAEAAIAQGLRVLVLVPEISLTPQLVGRFSRRLGPGIAILHSRLTELERAQEWWRARRGNADVVIGSRSAVFAPIPRLGLVIVDEEGSPAYKQDRMPRYEAGWVAERVAQITGSKLILGSATPAITTYRAALDGRLAIASMPTRVVGAPARVELVDMRDEAAAGHRLPLSRRLLQVVERSLAAEEQVILYLNRRGMSTLILCRECARAVECPNCSVALVQHPELDGLACHYCGFTQPEPEYCPYCGARHIGGRGMGTQRLEAVVKKIWPSARVLRLDSDSVRGPDAHLEILESFESRQADVLVGTQMVARGLDLEAVTAVGVVNADLPLHFPDYRSAENTFGLITQVAGRAGRSRRPSTVVVQTFNPDHYALRRTADGDYEGFYNEEMISRRAFSFPPFSDLAVLTFAAEDGEVAAATAREGAEQMASGLVGEGIEGIQMMGPAPAFIHRLRAEYRWQITLRGHDLGRARHLAPRGRGWSYDIDPVM